MIRTFLPAPPTMKRILLALILLTAGAAHAVNTIAWQKSVFDIAPMYTNNGGALDASFTFELGTFDSFAPDMSNLDQWAANWKLLDVGNWDPVDQAFGNSFTFNADGTVSGLVGSDTFVAGEQAYLWAHNGTEWALVTDFSGVDSNSRWMLPSMTVPNAGAFIWELPTADTVIVGGVNDIQSGTPHSFDPAPGFRLQTAVIPEPGSVLLLASAAAVFGLRRRRRAESLR